MPGTRSQLSSTTLTANNVNVYCSNLRYLHRQFVIFGKDIRTPCQAWTEINNSPAMIWYEDRSIIFVADTSDQTARYFQSKIQNAPLVSSAVSPPDEGGVCPDVRQGGEHVPQSPPLAVTDKVTLL